MDLHDFKWEEIRTLYSPRLKSVRFDTRGNSSGWLLITTNEVRVFSETATNTYPRRELLAITPTGNKELNNWSGKLIAGLTFRSGNTKEIEYNAHGTIERRTPSTRLTLDYLGNFSEINGTQTEDNQRATGNFDYFLSRRLFLRVPFVEYYRDPFQNLDQRLTVGGGVGYDLVHNRRVEWEVSAGPAFQRNWYSSVETNQSQTAEAVALTLGSRFDWEVTKRIDFILEFRGQFSDRETGNNSLHNVATLEFEIHKRLNLDISFIWDRIGSPKTESNGTTPFTDDFRLTLGVGIDF
jgi:putative salt-induced outer membrane protein YdiY